MNRSANQSYTSPYKQAQQVHENASYHSRFYTPNRRLQNPKPPIYSKPIINNTQQQQQTNSITEKRSSTPQPILSYQLQVYNKIKQANQEKKHTKKAKTLVNLPPAAPTHHYPKQYTLETEESDNSRQNTTDSSTEISQVLKGVLPPIAKGKQYTLVLDLDETLIHTFDMVGERVNFYTRPFCQEFLQQMDRYYEIVIFTAAMQDYADAIIDNIDPKGYISHRLYRQHMTQYRGNLIKDLSTLGRNLEKTIIIDNLKQNFEAQPFNGYEILDFFGKKKDRELPDLCILLNKIASEQLQDVRSVIPRGKAIIEECKMNQSRTILTKTIALNSPTKKGKGMFSSQNSLDSSESLSPIKDRYKQQFNFPNNSFADNLIKTGSNNNVNKSFQQSQYNSNLPKGNFLTPLKCGASNTNNINYREKLYSPQVGEYKQYNSKLLDKNHFKISSFMK